MNPSKLFLAISFSILISSFAFADPDIEIKPKKSSKHVTSKIKTLIGNLNFDLNKLDSKTVKLKFIVTESDQLLVLSTDQSILDKAIKDALNYKSVNTNDLKYNKVYILPVTFK